MSASDDGGAATGVAQPEGVASGALALREVLRLVDSGELEASAAERAHIAGAVDALEALGRT